MADSKTENVSVLIGEARGGNVEARDRLFALCRTYLGLVARSQVESGGATAEITLAFRAP